MELDAKSRKAYDELERMMVLQLPEDEADISVTSAAALSNKLLQLATVPFMTRITAYMKYITARLRRLWS